jgi:uncharacterized FlaG/YvyC family protein
MSINSLNNADSSVRSQPSLDANAAQATVIDQKAERKAIARTVIAEKREHNNIDALPKANPKPELEVRVGVMPDSDVILIRFVNATTGEVVREFPPEKLAEALAEIRARAIEHLDRKV